MVEFTIFYYIYYSNILLYIIILILLYFTYSYTTCSVVDTYVAYQLIE